MFNISQAITVFLCLMFLVDVLYGITGKTVLPGGEGFVLLVLVLAAYIGGVIVECIKLPPLVGMLAVGIVLRNVPLPFDVNIPQNIASSFRNVALVIILLKAGLGLDPSKLRTLKWVILRMSFLPSMLEAAITAVLSHTLLGMPWIWAFMLGFILTAVSAAVVIPGALELEVQQLGTRKGIPTLLMAAVSLDNVAALTGFYVLFNILTGGEGGTVWTTLLQFFQPFLGFVLGAIMGVLLWYFPSQRLDGYSITYYQVLLLCLGGLSFVFLSKKMEVSGIGAMSCVSLAFVASLEWRKNEEQFDRIKWITAKLWQLIEPFLFGIIGAQITIENLKNDIVNNIFTLLGGTLVRVLTIFLTLAKSPLDLKEKTFVALSWISKATVQAAVGSEAVEFSRAEHKGPEFEELGEKVLTLSVLVILITAPLGAILMNYLKYSLLENNNVVVKIVVTEDSNLPRTDCGDSGTNYGACRQDRPQV